MRELALSLETVFVLKDYEWKIGEDKHVPTADDILKVLEGAKKILDSHNDDEVQLEVGRLLFKKRAGVIDVFVTYGEI